MSYSAEQIASLIGAKLVGNHDSRIDWILTDSRSLCFPEESLFFALRTQRNDGHHYVADLYRRGVRHFVVEAIPGSPEDFADADFLMVKNPLKALQRLAERHRESFSIPVIGITGSNGKTIVKEWLYQILANDKAVARSPRSYNCMDAECADRSGDFRGRYFRTGRNGGLADHDSADYGCFHLSGQCASGKFQFDGRKMHREAEIVSGCPGAGLFCR